jgi:hypothetical protein
MQTILILAVAAIFLLLGITGYLTYLNWNTNLWTPIASSVAVGTFTLLLTLLMSMKEETIESQFITTMALDESNLPARIYPPSMNRTVRTRYDSFFRLARIGKTVDGKMINPTIAPPKTPDEIFNMCKEVVQYNVLKDIRENSFDGAGAETMVLHDRIRLTPLHRVAYKPDDIEEIQGTNFIDNPSDCRLLEADIDYWKMFPTKLPRGVRIQLSFDKEKHCVQISKAGFFKATIEVEAIMGAQGGSIIDAISLPTIEATKKLRTHVLRIKCSATFEKWTAGNAMTEQYKNWIKYLFGQLELAYKDN